MPACNCEEVSQSEHPSPGPVASSERLLRLVFLPEEVNDNGTIKPTAWEKKDLRRDLEGQKPSRGFSTNREDYVSRDQLVASAADFQSRAPDRREAVKVFGANVSDIRNLMLDGERALCVVDRALKDDLSHAECWGAAAGRSEAKLKKIRADLAGLFQPLFDVP